MNLARDDEEKGQLRLMKTALRVIAAGKHAHWH
jgi:hypothetical protein